MVHKHSPLSTSLLLLTASSLALLAAACPGDAVSPPATDQSVTDLIAPGDGVVDAAPTADTTPGCVPAPEICNGKDDDCDGATDEGCACKAGAKRPCGSSVGLCSEGTQSCTGGTWGPCQGGVKPTTERCNGKDDDCDGKTDETFTSLGKPCDGADSDGCAHGSYTCAPDGSGVRCVNETKTNIKEVCNGVDDDCDGKVDDGLATDKGSFPGCANYRGMISKAIAIFDASAKANALTFRWTAAARTDTSDLAAFELLARAEFLRATQGVPLPAGTRTRIIDQAILQADGFLLWEAAGAKAKAVRAAAGITHSCRGWYGEKAKATVSHYWTGPILLGLELLARAIYEDKLTGSRAAKADAYHQLVGQVIDHWSDAAGPHFKTKSTSIPGIGKENWVCMEEPSSSCTLSGGARAVKWNVTTWFWRAVATWNDVDNKHKGSTTTYRRVRAVRFCRWMKQDMLDSSGTWSNTKPYVWHAWADAPSSYPYIEDASHGAWDVGLMVEAWRGGWKDEASAAVMGSGSASRFRRTYLDNLALANNPCVGLFTDGSQQIVGHTYYGKVLKSNRRGHLTEWIGMADKDQTFLEEIYEDLTGVCDGYNMLGQTQRIALGYARFIREIRTIRGE